METLPAQEEGNPVERRTIRTSAKRAAAHFVGMPFVEWAQHQRDRGMSWTAIAEELRHRSDGIVDVSRETVRYWYVSDTGTQP